MSDIGFTPDPDGLADLDLDVRTASIIWAGDDPPRLVLSGISEWEAVALLERASFELGSRLDFDVEGYDEDDDDD